MEQQEDSRTAVEKLEAGDITFQDYLVELAKELIARGEDVVDVEKTIRREVSKLYPIES